MQKKPDKSRRKEILRSLAERGQKMANEERPISLLDLGDLFDHLDARLSVEGCNHTLEETEAFLNSRDLDSPRIMSWLKASNGFCDCEVLANIEESWAVPIQKFRLDIQNQKGY